MAKWIEAKWEAIKKEAFKYQPHHPGRYQFITRSVCLGCGLIYLQNPLTTWCIQRGCNYEDDPKYKSKVKELGKT
jgi:hypothetical protein